MTATDVLNIVDLHMHRSMIALRDYEARLIGEGKKSKTRDGYIMMAARFEKFKGEAPYSNDVALRFRDQLASNVQHNSMIPYLCALNHYLGYLGHSDMKLEVPRWQKKTVLPLTRDEVQRMVVAAGEDPDPLLARRNLAIMLIFVDGAARISEVCNLRIQDLDMANGKLWARATKSGADRPIYVSDPTIQAVQAWLSVRPRPTAMESKDVLFLSRQGRRMDINSAREMVHRCAARANIQRRVWPHLLRHSRLTQLGEDGASAYEIKEIAGHETLEMGVKYVHMSEQAVRRAMLSRPIIAVEAPRPNSASQMDTDTAKVELALRLASGGIDLEGFKMAMGALATKDVLEELR